MGRRVILVDDLDGSETDDVEARQFTWDGKLLQADLTERNWTIFLDLIAPFVDVAVVKGRYTVQESKGVANARPPVIDSNRHSAEDLSAVRDWANSRRVRLPAGGGKIANIVWAAWRANRVDMIPDKYMLDDGEENTDLAVAAASSGRRTRRPQDDAQEMLETAQ